MAKITYKEMLEELNSIRNEDADLWGIFFLGTQLFLGKTRVYASQANARRRLISGFSYYTTEQHKEQVTKIVDKMETSGMLEFRQIGDRTPKFPYNKTSIDQEQKEKFVKMIDSTDKEMVELATTILAEIK